MFADIQAVVLRAAADNVFRGAFVRIECGMQCVPFVNEENAPVRSLLIFLGKGHLVHPFHTIGHRPGEPPVADGNLSRCGNPY